jgi:hypothetical protein
MTNEEFIGLTEAEAAARGEALRALWLEARGDWTRAHATAQRAGGADRSAAWVHAYLHRVEGDELNAGYWYAKAGRGRPAPGVNFATERAGILSELWK